jgi:hypothetical protein
LSLPTAVMADTHGSGRQKQTWVKSEAVTTV